MPRRAKRNFGESDARDDYHNEKKWEKELEEREKELEEEKRLLNNPVVEMSGNDIDFYNVGSEDTIAHVTSITITPFSQGVDADEMNNTNLWYRPEETTPNNESAMQRIETTVQDQRKILDELDKQVKELILYMDEERRTRTSRVVDRPPPPNEDPCCVIS
jgi:uncharacterized coiled-coil protein SlyX